MSNLATSKPVASKVSLNSLKYVISFYTFLFLVWGFYRYLFRLPEEIEEIIVKPIIWLIPLVFILKREKRSFSSLGITKVGLFPSLYFVLILGAAFAVIGLLVNFVKYDQFSFTANIGQKTILASLFISLVTAVSEELAFRGYIFNRLWEALKNEYTANFITSLLWGAIHLPVTVFVWRLDLFSTIVYFALTIIFGIGSAFIFTKTRNVASSVFLHVFWQWPIALFR